MTLLTIVSWLFLALPDLSSAPREGPRAADVAAIRAHVESVFRAYMAKDREAVRRTHGKHWRGFLTGSREVIRGIDEYMKTAEGSLGSPVKIESWSFRDFDVVFYGDIGVVSYVADLDLGLEGQRWRDTLRVIDVYHRSGKEWNQVASQVARHPDALDARAQQPQPLPAPERTRLLNDREAVWRAFFGNDQAVLARVVPEDLVAINAGEEAWSGQADVLASAAAFAKSGARLVRLEFPKTEIRVYGDTAILYTTYVYGLEKDGKGETTAGRGTEIFVRRAGRWVNAGWHLDSGK